MTRFFAFISEKKQPVRWDETHLPPKVILPKQVLILGDGQAEKRCARACIGPSIGSLSSSRVR